MPLNYRMILVFGLIVAGLLLFLVLAAWKAQQMAGLPAEQKEKLPQPKAVGGFIVGMLMYFIVKNLTQHAIIGPPKKLEPFTPAEGGYSVLLPGTPERKVINLPGTGGLQIIGYHAFLDRNREFASGAMDLPEALQDPEKTSAELEGAKSEILKNPEAQKISENNISLEGYPGTEMLWKEKGGYSFGRFYIANGKFIELIAHMPNGDPMQSPEVVQVFNSLSFGAKKASAPVSKPAASKPLSDKIRKFKMVYGEEIEGRVTEETDLYYTVDNGKIPVVVMKDQIEKEE